MIIVVCIVAFARNKRENYHSIGFIKFWNFLPIITGELYKKNYAKAREYLALVSVTTIPAEIYYIHFNLRYLKNLTYYLYTGKMRYYKEVIAVIDMIESFGDVRLAEGMKKEMLQLTAGRTFNLEKGQFPLNIVTEK